MGEKTKQSTKAPLFGGRELLFSQRELLLLVGPLLVEQLLEVTVGMADTMMVSRCGEAAISGVSLVDMINIFERISAVIGICNVEEFFLAIRN